MKHRLETNNFHNAVLAFFLASYEEKIKNELDELADAYTSTVEMLLTEDQQKVLLQVKYMTPRKLQVHTVESKEFMILDGHDWDKSGMLSDAYSQIRGIEAGVQARLKKQMDAFTKGRAPLISRRRGHPKERYTDWEHMCESFKDMPAKYLEQMRGSPIPETGGVKFNPNGFNHGNADAYG